MHRRSLVSLFALLLFAVAALIGCARSDAPGGMGMPPSTRPPSTQTVAAAPAQAADAVSYLKPIERKPGELRAAWVHDNSIATPDKIDEIIRRAELGGINVILASVFEQGMALFDSQLASKHAMVQPDFNPLPYLVEQAHRRGIQVHAWFVNGPVDYKEQSSIIAQHPEWAIVGPDGKTKLWLNFTRPDVRQFIGDLMWETITRYGVDGVFFDFTRYPGPEWGFDPYSVAAFDGSHSFKLDELRYPTLPAFGFFQASPVLEPSTAQVLAEFRNGTPALTINDFGQGQVILLNWRASGRVVASDSEIMRRSIAQLLEQGGQVHIYKPDGELDDNSKQSLGEMAEWLNDLGHTATLVLAKDIPGLAPSSVLVVTYGYAITPEGAASMSDWVRRGGGLIFNDGPVRSMNLEPIRALTGMQKRGKHVEEFTFLLPRGPSPLVPTGNRSADLALAEQRDAEWKAFRKQGVNALIQSIYQRIKSQYPQVDVSVTVTSDQTTAGQQTMQDWRAWLEGGYVDYVVPRGYVEEVEELADILSAWQPALQKYKRITLGVSTFTGKHSQRVLKTSTQLLEEVSRARQAGSYGIMLWNLDYLNDEQLKALAAGPFR
ncbi:MAG: family 10 glycosylhydrolase [Chloroflexi bacterium]|nr:family 10 glycosylhydrolase [Chloroflexota bacterium]